MKDMTQKAILYRVVDGTANSRDAEQLQRWLCPTLQESIVKAYYLLRCNSHKVCEFIAADLRQALADEITKDSQ